MVAPKHATGEITSCLQQSFSAENVATSASKDIEKAKCVIADCSSNRNIFCSCPSKRYRAVRSRTAAEVHFLTGPTTKKRERKAEGFSKEYINRQWRICSDLLPHIFIQLLSFTCTDTHAFTHPRKILRDFWGVWWPLFYLYVPG